MEQTASTESSVSRVNRRRKIRLVALAVVLSLGAVVLGLFSLQRSAIARRQGVVFFGLPDVRFWLTGQEVTTPITDWSFADPLASLRIQTQTWYQIPYSVTIWFARHGDQLYLYSNYMAPEPGQPDLRDRFPAARAWNRNLVRDPRCRVQIADKVFNCRAYPITDGQEMAVAREAFFIRYPQLRDSQNAPEARRSRLYFFRVVPQWEERQ
jgi:hypothetical protein